MFAAINVNYVVKELSIGQCVAPLRCEQKQKSTSFQLPKYLQLVLCH